MCLARCLKQEDWDPQVSLGAGFGAACSEVSNIAGLPFPYRRYSTVHTQDTMA